MVNYPKVLNFLSSDHYPIMLTISADITFTKNMYRCYNNANWQLFSKYLKNIKFPVSIAPTTTEQDIDDFIETLEQHIQHALNISVPLRPVKLGAVVIPAATSELIKRRNCLRRQWERTRDPYQQEQLKMCNKLIRNHLINFRNLKWNHKLEDLTKASNNFWKIVKVIKKKHQPIPSLEFNSITYVENRDKANLLKEIFVDKHKLTTSFSDPETENLVKSSLNVLQTTLPPTSEEIKISYEEVKSLIKLLKPKKSPGIDCLNNKCIKALPKNVLLFLAQLYSFSIKLSYFPTRWKIAKVLPVHKPEKPVNSPESYRPISLLNSFSKIFEKILKHRIMLHIEENKVLPNFQFGFRPEHNCNHCLLRVKKFVKSHLQQKQSVAMVTLDIQAAFDTVWHDGLLHKLISLNLPISLTKIIANFLANRKFLVSINGVSSDMSLIPAGVPQGSVLGPILYNIYTSDIPTPSNCQLSMFADDTAIFTSGNSPLKIISDMQTSLEVISKYYHRWKIKVNSSKTKAIFFTRKRKTCHLPSSQLHLNSIDIPWNDSLKYLGLYLDKKLLFGLHIQQSLLKANKLIKILYPFINRRSPLSIDNKLIIYKAIFKPTLIYGCPVWYNSAKCHIDKLQIFQNKILKMIFNLPFFYATERLHNKSHIDYVIDSINKISAKFSDKLAFSTNDIIKNLSS